MTVTRRTCTSTNLTSCIGSSPFTHLVRSVPELHQATPGLAAHGRRPTKRRNVKRSREDYHVVESPLWVINGRGVIHASRPFFPSKRTFISTVCTSA